MPLMIFSLKNRLEKCAEFTKMVRRICRLHSQNFKFSAQNSDNPSYMACWQRHTCGYLIHDNNNMHIFLPQ